MSLTTIVMFALGYLAVLTAAMCLLAAAKRADERAQEEHEALVRSTTGDAVAPERPGHDPDRELISLRRMS